MYLFHNDNATSPSPGVSLSPLSVYIFVDFGNNVRWLFDFESP